MMFNTLNEALEAGNPELVALFPVGVNVPYNHSVRGVSEGVFFSVYRDSRGLYETATFYASKMDNWVQVYRNE